MAYQEYGVQQMTIIFSHQHRNGRFYEELMRGLKEDDLTPVVIYRGESGQVWVRPSSEFDDGRFTSTRGVN